MTLSDGILLGVVQGITEVFPISSSGHLYLTQIWLGLEPSLWFEIVLHGVTLLAVLVVMRRDIIALLRNFWSAEVGKFVLATGLTVLGALLLEQTLFSNLSVQMVGIFLLINALCIWGAYRLYTKKEKRSRFTWQIAALVGVVQAIAVLPGISRSGITIAFLLAAGVEKHDALRISFLLSIPTIIGAMVFALADNPAVVWDSSVLIGSLVAFLLGWLCLKLFFARTLATWRAWGVYCFLVGIGLLVFTRLPVAP